MELDIKAKRLVFSLISIGSNALASSPVKTSQHVLKL
jgi:hypothetical protein